MSVHENLSALTFNSTEQDPALFDEELRRKLDENQRIGKSRLEEVSSSFKTLAKVACTCVGMINLISLLVRPVTYSFSKLFCMDWFCVNLLFTYYKLLAPTLKKNGKSALCYSLFKTKCTVMCFQLLLLFEVEMVEGKYDSVCHLLSINESRCFTTHTYL